MAAAKVIAEYGRKGAYIPMDKLREKLGGLKNLNKLLGKLTVIEKVHASRSFGAAPTVRHAYIRGDNLIIPRIKCAALLSAHLIDGIVQAADALPLPRLIDEEKCKEEEPLYEYQEAAVKHLCENYFSDDQILAFKSVAYLQMDTGLGKSRVGCGVIARRREPALVVVPTEAIGNQWVDEFADLYPKLNVAFYHNLPKGSRKIQPSPLSHDVIIIIVNTFRDKPPEFLEGFGTIVIDEAHEYHSARNLQALWLSQTRAVLGLSATPTGRPDGLDIYVNLHLGPVIYPKDIPGFDICSVNFRGTVRVINYIGHPDYCESVITPTGTMSAIMTIGSIIMDPYRTALIANEVKRIYRLHETSSPEELIKLGLGPRPQSAATATHPAGEIRRHGIFIFAEHRDYLPIIGDAISKVLSDAEILVPEISLLRGGVTKNTVDAARQRGAHIVLTTYGFSRRGISLPDMTCIIEATPRRNGMHQILGRILRRGSDESIVRQIIDIVDTRTGLKSQITDRRKVYKEKNYELLKPIKISWDAIGGDNGDNGGGGDNGDNGDNGDTEEQIDELFSLISDH